MDWPKCRALAARLARNGTWVTTTLVGGTVAVDTTRPHDPRLRYFEPATLAAWRAEPRPAPAPPDRPPAPGDSGRQPIRMDAAGAYVRALARARVGIMAGTDAPAITTFPASTCTASSRCSSRQA